MRLFGARSTAEAKRASGRAHRPELAPKRGFELTISAFALAGVAMIGALDLVRQLFEKNGLLSRLSAKRRGDMAPRLG